MLASASLPLHGEVDTAHRAARFAAELKAGDTILLEGPIGAGKSTFARAIIRALCGSDTEVPSPTFTLVQTYDCAPAPIWHCDLYRIGDPQEAVELGLEEAFASAICLIEWPDRLGDLRPEGALHLTMTADPETPDLHHLSIADPHDKWAGRLEALRD